MNSALRRPCVRAPELVGRGWLNTAGRPLSLAELRGRIVLLDFWTFCCVNCLHVLEELRPLEERYDDVLVTALPQHPLGPAAAPTRRRRAAGRLRGTCPLPSPVIMHFVHVARRGNRRAPASGPFAVADVSNVPARPCTKCMITPEGAVHEVHDHAGGWGARGRRVAQRPRSS